MIRFGTRAAIFITCILAILITPHFAEATDVYGGSFTWNVMLRIRMGSGFNSLWTEGPYSATGHFSYTDGANPR